MHILELGQRLARELELRPQAILGSRWNADPYGELLQGAFPLPLRQSETVGPPAKGNNLEGVVPKHKLANVVIIHVCVQGEGRIAALFLGNRSRRTGWCEEDIQKIRHKESTRYTQRSVPVHVIRNEICRGLQISVPPGIQT